MLNKKDSLPSGENAPARTRGRPKKSEAEKAESLAKRKALQTERPLTTLEDNQEVVKKRRGRPSKKDLEARAILEQQKKEEASLTSLNGNSQPARKRGRPSKKELEARTLVSQASTASTSSTGKKAPSLKTENSEEAATPKRRGRPSKKDLEASLEDQEKNNKASIIKTASKDLDDSFNDDYEEDEDLEDIDLDDDTDVEDFDFEDLIEEEKTDPKKLVSANIQLPSKEEILVKYESVIPSYYNVEDEEKPSLDPNLSADFLEGLGLAPYMPKEDEYYMSDEQLAHIRRILVCQKKDIHEALENTKVMMAQTSENPADDLDKADREQDIQVILRARDRERRLEQKIDDTIRRLNNMPDEFGYCQSCGEEIGLRRLEVRPTTEYCLKCKSKAEHLENTRR